MRKEKRGSFLYFSWELPLASVPRVRHRLSFLQFSKKHAAPNRNEGALSFKSSPPMRAMWPGAPAHGVARRFRDNWTQLGAVRWERICERVDSGAWKRQLLFGIALWRVCHVLTVDPGKGGQFVRTRL